MSVATAAATATAAAAAAAPPAPDAAPDAALDADAAPAAIAAAAAASLRALLAVQGRRAQAYARLHAAFRKLLAAGGGRPLAADEAAFAALLEGDLTPEFQRLSSRARELGAALASSGFAEEAAIVAAVQLGERDKLRLTLTLQQLRRPHAARAFSWQRGGGGGGGAGGNDDEGGPRADDAGIGGPLDPAELAARRARGCGCGHGHGHGHARHDQGVGKDQGGAAADAGAAEAAAGDDDDDDEEAAAAADEAAAASVAEPTEEEWRGAVAEATAELDVAIGRINEALEEAVQLLEEEEEG